MSKINPESVVAMGASLAGIGQSQVEKQIINQTAISWEDAQKKVLVAELKAQCSYMSDGVRRVLEVYRADEPLEVREALKIDAQRLNYMISGNQYFLSSGFGNTPFNMENVKNERNHFQLSAAENYSDFNVFVEKEPMQFMEMENSSKTINKVENEAEINATMLKAMMKQRMVC